MAMNEKPGLYAALGGFLFFNGALVLFSAFFSTWFLGREWVASICSPRCREGFFSELHIHTPTPLYGTGAYIPRVSALSLHSV